MTNSLNASKWITIPHYQAWKISIPISSRHRRYHNFQPQYQYQYPKTHLSNTNTNTNTSDLANLNTNTNTNTWKNLNTQYSIPIPQYQYLTLVWVCSWDNIIWTSCHILCKDEVSWQFEFVHEKRLPKLLVTCGAWMGVPHQF